MTASTPGLAWLAPEAFDQVSPCLSSVSDVYSFGWILWELCGGAGVAGPSHGRSAADLLASGGAGFPDPALMFRDTTSPSTQVVAQLRRVVTACCNAAPHMRPPIAGVVTSLLETLFGKSWFEIPNSSLVLLGRLGCGEFGDVNKMALTLHRPNASKAEAIFVAVKTQKNADGVSPDEVVKKRTEFLAEAELMKRLRHPNLVGLLGTSVDRAGNTMVVLEYLPGGALDDWVSNNGMTAAPEVLVSFLYQTALGMVALGELSIVHRDLAGRNILVGGGNSIKVADFGLSRDAEEDRDYYRQQTEHPLPLRWSAPEVIRDRAWKTSTDVFSFGVVISEIYSFGAFPFDDMQDQELIKLFTDRAGDPIFTALNFGPKGRAPDTVVRLAAECLARDSDQRPTFRRACELLLPSRWPHILGDGHGHGPGGRYVPAAEYDSENYLSVAPASSASKTNYEYFPGLKSASAVREETVL